MAWRIRPVLFSGARGKGGGGGGGAYLARAQQCARAKDREHKGLKRTGRQRFVRDCVQGNGEEDAILAPVSQVNLREQRGPKEPQRHGRGQQSLNNMHCVRQHINGSCRLAERTARETLCLHRGIGGFPLARLGLIPPYYTWNLMEQANKQTRNKEDGTPKCTWNLMDLCVFSPLRM